MWTPFPTSGTRCALSSRMKCRSLRGCGSVQLHPKRTVPGHRDLWPHGAVRRARLLRVRRPLDPTRLLASRSRRLTQEQPLGRPFTVDKSAPVRATVTKTARSGRRSTRLPAPVRRELLLGAVPVWAERRGALSWYPAHRRAVRAGRPPAVLLAAATAVLLIPLAVERVGLPAVVTGTAVVAVTTIAGVSTGPSPLEGGDEPS